MKYKAMNKVEAIVYNELKGKNAGSDTIKMLVRVAVETSRLVGDVDFTDEEINEMLTELFHSLPFNPLEDVF